MSKYFGLFDAYTYMLDYWQSASNVLGSDFKLYSTLEDTLADTNPWTYCNYDFAGLGFPRDCGPLVYTDMNWNSLSNTNGVVNYQFKVMKANPASAKTIVRFAQNTVNTAFTFKVQSTDSSGNTYDSEIITWNALTCDTDSGMLQQYCPYTKLEQACIYGNNLEANYENTELEQCQKLCDERTGCLSIDYERTLKTCQLGATYN